MCHFQVITEPADAAPHGWSSLPATHTASAAQQLPASPSSSPRFSTMMQMCFLSWRMLENFRAHLAHSRRLGAGLRPSSGASGQASLGPTMLSASSSSVLGFFVDPLGLPLFLFMTESSAKETRGSNGVTLATAQEGTQLPRLGAGLLPRCIEKSVRPFQKLTTANNTLNANTSASRG